ncbi:MAG: hypothetical protein TR69_WS6001000908 [candidate division WS6 bacterium OLB20]|uniref:Uncharacterized protein n=1 Tax=candidate division WS6 bacterium OLB20 TaxID=1617426 RepID=A0A136LZ03_9BACT|nr:MAG: hypothetical protein TR69_WS6001000908 [candidate division WS6 bacterium OLB20]
MEMSDRPVRHTMSPADIAEWLEYDAGFSGGFDPDQVAPLPLPSNLPYPALMHYNKSGAVSSLQWGPDRQYDAVRDIEGMLATGSREQLCIVLLRAAGIPVASGAVAETLNKLKPRHAGDFHSRHFYKPVARNNGFLNTIRIENMPAVNGSGIRLQRERTLIVPENGIEANSVVLGHVVTGFLQSAEQESADVNSWFGVRRGAKNSAGMIVSMMQAIDASIAAGQSEKDSSGNHVITNSILLKHITQNGPYLAPERELYLNRIAYPILQRWHENDLITYSTDLEQRYIPDQTVRNHAAFCRNYEQVCEEQGGTEHVAVLVAGRDYKPETVTLYRVLADWTAEHLDEEISMELCYSSSETGCRRSSVSILICTRWSTPWTT